LRYTVIVWVNTASRVFNLEPTQKSTVCCPKSSKSGSPLIDQRGRDPGTSFRAISRNRSRPGQQEPAVNVHHAGKSADASSFQPAQSLIAKQLAVQ